MYLIEDGAVQAQKPDVHRLVQLPDGADVEHLAIGLQIRVVAANHFANAREIRVGQVVKVQKLRVRNGAMISHFSHQQRGDLLSADRKDVNGWDVNASLNANKIYCDRI